MGQQGAAPRRGSALASALPSSSSFILILNLTINISAFLKLDTDPDPRNRMDLVLQWLLRCKKKNLLISDYR